MTMKLAGKKLVVIVFSLMIWLPSFSNAQTLIDKIIVIVNDDVITENDLEKRILRFQVTNNRQEVNQNLRDRILQNMVEELVQLQSARRVGINVTDVEVDRFMNRFLNQRKTTEQEFTTKLASVGLSIDDFRESMKTRSILAKLVRSDAIRAVKVSDEEIETFAKANNIKPNSAEYDVSFLFVKSSEASSEQQKETLLKDVKSLQNQSKNVDINQLALILKSAQINVEKKDLGFSPAEKLPSIFVATLAKMDSGSLSEPIKTSSGIYILKLNSVRGGVVATEKRKAQHILIKAVTPLEIQQAQKTLTRLLGDINSGVEFENIAKFYSDDSGSAAKGGDLGWMRKGQAVPRFEAKLFSMNEGEVSEPVVTRFGVHLIKLNEVSKVSDPDEQMKVIAYNNLMSRKVDQYFPTFLSKLMGKAYIKYL